MASVVVTCFDDRRLPLLRRCLAGVLAGTRVPEEVVVVVDSNPALLATVGAEWGDRGVTVVASRGRGASEARNTGAARARGSVIVFVDDDVRPSPAWLAAMVEPFDRDPSVMVVGGHIRPEYEPGARRLPDEVLWLVGCTYGGHPPGPGFVSRPIGSTMAWRADVLAGLGGFSPAFGPLGARRLNSNEELALCERLRSAHGRDHVWYEPAAVVHHWVPKERVTWRYTARRSLTEGTSKAEIRRRYGVGAMGHDSSYVTAALLPGVGRRVRDRALGEAARLVAVGGLTAAGYAGRRLRHGLVPAR